MSVDMKNAGGVLLALLVAPNVFALAYRLLPDTPRAPAGHTPNALTRPHGARS